MALQTGKGVPFDYIEYKLCEKLHCLPSQLKKESWSKIDNFLSFMDIEAQFQKREDKKLEREYGGK